MYYVNNMKTVFDNKYNQKLPHNTESSGYKGCHQSLGPNRYLKAVLQR